MDSKVCLIAHRGIHDNKSIPENSILAFEKAIELNYPIELDVQLTKDNVLIVFHDKNLKRMTECNKNVNEIVYNEIKKLKLLNTDQTIPTLSEVLKLVNGKVDLYIEIKSTHRIKKICSTLNNELKLYNYKHIIQSFNPKIVSWFKRYNPYVYRGLLISKDYYSKFYGKLLIKYCNPNFLSISKKYIDKYNLNLNNKYDILIWTIKDTKEINEYINISKTFICNNLPFEE